MSQNSRSLSHALGPEVPTAPTPGVGAWPHRQGFRTQRAEKKKEKDIRWSGCPSPPTPRGRGLCWDVAGPLGRPARIRAARTRLHESNIRRARGDCRTATARAGLRPVDATSSAPGVRASRVRTGRQRGRAWPGGSPLETSVTCDLLSEPGPVKYCDSSRPHRPDGRVMNLVARYASHAPLSSASVIVTETSSNAVEPARRNSPTHGCIDPIGRAGRHPNFVPTCVRHGG